MCALIRPNNMQIIPGSTSLKQLIDLHASIIVQIKRLKGIPLGLKLLLQGLRDLSPIWFSIGIAVLDALAGDRALNLKDIWARCRSWLYRGRRRRWC